MNRKPRSLRISRKPAIFHCEVCESVVKYHTLVMRYYPTLNQIRTPSGLTINLKEK